MVERIDARQALGADCTMRHRVFGVALKLDNATVSDMSQNTAILNTTAAARLYDFCITAGRGFNFSCRPGSFSIFNQADRNRLVNCSCQSAKRCRLDQRSS